MQQTPLPFFFFRGGTSRGPYFLRSNLPDDRDALSDVLISVVGAGNARNIDGLGGGSTVTTKVAMLSRSDDPDVDVDYFFAQVAVEKRLVDYGPTCGNILVGVAPAAIEMGLVPMAGDETLVRIRAVNTGALVEAVVQTPATAAPIALNFLDVVGSRSGSMLPTGEVRDTIDGIEVTCIDVAMPMMIARAIDFGIKGTESQVELDENKALFERMEAIRLEAGRRMGFGDVTEQVTPKIGLIAEPLGGGHMTARYFMPWAAHPTLAITGSQCLAACALTPGSIAEGIARPLKPAPAVIRIEHPSGVMEITVNYQQQEDGLRFISAGVVRTARLIARGEVMVPAGVFPKEAAKHP